MHPVARRCNRRGLAKPDHRGNIQGNGWRLRRSGHAEFSLPRGAAVPPSSFINLPFTSQRSLLWYFLGLQESTVPSPSRPPPSFYLRGLAKYDIMLQGIPFRLFLGGFGAGRLRPAARSDRWITWWKVCGRAAKTPVTAGLFSPLLGESAFGDNVDNRFWGGQNRPFGGEAPHCLPEAAVQPGRRAAKIRAQARQNAVFPKISPAHPRLFHRPKSQKAQARQKVLGLSTLSTAPTATTDILYSASS